MISIDGVGDTPRGLADLLNAKRTVPRKYIFRYGRNNIESSTSVKFNDGFSTNKYDFLVGLKLYVKDREIEYFSPVELAKSRSSRLTFGRSNRHTQGKDIFIQMPGKSYKSLGANVDYYTSGVHIEKEYRYHFVFNHLIPCLKYKELETGNWWSDYIRNYENGWRFSICKPRDRLVRAAWHIQKWTGLHFGAIDMALDVNNKLYIFEVNTAPSLDIINMELYKQWFQEIVDLYEEGGTYEPLCGENPEGKKMSELFDIYRHTSESESTV